MQNLQKIEDTQIYSRQAPHGEVACCYLNTDTVEFEDCARFFLLIPKLRRIVVPIGD